MNYLSGKTSVAIFTKEGDGYIRGKERGREGEGEEKEREEKGTEDKM